MCFYKRYSQAIHILQFELLNKDSKDIGVFKPKVVDHFIHKDKLHVQSRRSQE